MSSYKRNFLVIESAKGKVYIDRISGCSYFEHQMQYLLKENGHLIEVEYVHTNDKPIAEAASLTSSQSSSQEVIVKRLKKDVGNEATDAFKRSNFDGNTFETKQEYKAFEKLTQDAFLKGQYRVCGQFDQKFIVCRITTEKSNNLLVAFDQHAVHERIRFESLLKEVFVGGGFEFNCHSVLPPLLIKHRFSSNLVDLQSKIRDLVGIDIRMYPDGQFHVYSYLKVLKQVTDVKSAIIELVQEALSIATIGQHQGVTNSKVTPKLAEKLASLACHGAIRFGDALKILDCQKLLQTLRRCSLPFQCAHGRPSMAPIYKFD